LIISFGDNLTADIYHGRQTRRVIRFPQNVLPATLRKLDMIESAHNLNDLRIPTSNHLEQLMGKKEGWSSIRINDQYRVLFQRESNGALNVKSPIITGVRRKICFLITEFLPIQEKSFWKSF
jgi:proteic killer suppression protein